MRSLNRILAFLLPTMFSLASHAWFVECPDDVIAKILQNDLTTINRILSQKAELKLEFLQAKDVVNNISKKYGYQTFDEMDSDLMNRTLSISPEDRLQLDMYWKTRDSLQIRGESGGLSACAEIANDQRQKQNQK